MHACSNSLMQRACERLKTSAWTSGSQKPALVGPHCIVWPPERPDEPSTISPSLQSQIDQLVGHWLGPINGSHVKFSSANLARHRGFNEPRIPTDPSVDHQGCLGCTGWGRMVQLSVRSCQIYLTEGPDNPMYAHISVGGCGQVAPELDTSREAHRKAHGVAHASDRHYDDESAPSFVDTAIRWHGANLNARLLTVLRLLRAALDKGSIYSGGSQGCAYPDFDFELSLDDTCHGLLNGDAQPMFAMVSCPMRTIPVVQWNAIGGRDIDLSRWDATLAYRRAMREKLRAQWHCRRQVAVFRGEAHAEYGVLISERNAEARQVTALVQRVHQGSWKRQGRFALIFQKCKYPELLDVRVNVLRKRKAWKKTGLQNDTQFAACVQRARDRPKKLSLEEQAALFQMVVCVEGNGGWADRLRHLLLSGMVVLKQQTVALEWFEPLLLPWVHYVPISASLHNLSDAVLWVRANPIQAMSIIDAGARFIEEITSTRGLHAYIAVLFRGYAGIQSTHAHPLRNVQSWHSRFNCVATSKLANCSFVAPG